MQLTPTRHDEPTRTTPSSSNNPYPFLGVRKKCAIGLKSSSSTDALALSARTVHVIVRLIRIGSTLRGHEQVVLETNSHTMPDIVHCCSPRVTRGPAQLHIYRACFDKRSFSLDAFLNVNGIAADFTIGGNPEKGRRERSNRLLHAR